MVSKFFLTSCLTDDQTPDAADDDVTVDEDSGPTTIDVLDNDTDPNGQPLTITEATVPADQGTVDIVDNELVFTPADDFNGDAQISYTVTDPNGNTDTATVNVTVDPVNDAPEAVDDVASTDFETPVTIDVLDNDTDVDSPDLAITDASVPADQGTVAIVDNQLVFTPAEGFEGPATITYEVSDGALTDTAEVVVDVAEEPADGVVDGADTGEVMDPGYVDDQGDEIDGNDGNDTLAGNEGTDTIDGGAGNDDIDGGDDDDVLDGGAGDDTIEGGEGNDSIEGGEGNDVVDGGTGDDVIDTSGPVDPDTNLGTPDLGYPGVLAGDEDPSDDLDTVFGGAGDDTIRTGDDADSIDGGAGNDTIDGGFDADEIAGGDGDDRIVGGEGSDTIEGGDGDDTIYAGNDPVLGLDQFNIEDDGSNPVFGPDLVPNNGTDTVFGGAGNDTIFGADDADVLFGGADDDVIDGGIDDDVIEGGEGNDVIIGGQGADDLSGGFGDDTFIVDGEGDGADDVIVGGEDADDNDVDVLDLTGSNVASIAYTGDDPESESGVVTFDDGSTLAFSEIETVIPCFTPGTLIATSQGQRLVQDLQAGDKILTRDNGFQEIAWTGHKDLSGLALTAAPELKPISVKAGALGGGLPTRDMLLSPNHKVLISSVQAELYFQEKEVFVAAKYLVGQPGITQVEVPQTTYIHFMFERHEVVLSDGAWSESFHPGDYAIDGIDSEARDEILALFPELATQSGMKRYRLARMELKKREAKLLIG